MSLELSGALREEHSGALRSILLRTAEERPDELVVDVNAVEVLDVAAATCLIEGYNSAVDHGASFRVVGVRAQPRRLLERLGILDMLADSDDVGALLLACCRQFLPGVPEQ